MTNIYLGIVEGIHTDSSRGITKEYHAVKVNIPTFGEGFIAFPKSGCLDEPKEGDPVLCLDLDPLYHSYMVYEPLKESDVIGFRASGKAIDITPEAITIGIYDPSENTRKNNGEEKSIDDFNLTAKIVIDKGGDITIETNKDVDIRSRKLTFNGGVNGGLVNVRELKTIINCLHGDMTSVGLPCVLMKGIGTQALGNIEDTDFKH